jgi:general secretion pathway protein G
LLELLVVIAIIAILIALLLVGVMRVIIFQYETQNSKDIEFLQSSANKFKARYGIYPPSRILLSNNPTVYQGGDPNGPAAWQILTKIWPRLDSNTSYDWSNGTMQATGLVDANGFYSVWLEGDQCLVFFLGGLPLTSPMNDCKGFGDSDRNPTSLTGKLVKPFFTFDQTRLYRRNPQHTFFSYFDSYGVQPYLYFSSFGGKLGTYNDGDCASLGVAPYFHGYNLVQKQIVAYDPTNNLIAKQYENPESVQIICAGQNQQFGPGGEWNPVAPVVPPAGRDDVSNFSATLLGAPRTNN